MEGRVLFSLFILLSVQLSFAAISRQRKILAGILLLIVTIETIISLLHPNRQDPKPPSLAVAVASIQCHQIVGGHEARPHSRPYAAALKLYGRFACGGFLIAPRWVLTAAHCRGQITVILGAHDLNAVEDTTQVLGVESYHQYPGYRIIGDTPFNDILLLKLDREPQLNQNVQIIPLPKTDSDLPANTRCFVAGWGRIDDRFQTSSKLFETNITITGRRKCLLYIPELTDEMMCAGSLSEKCDVSNGDSGSALVCNGVAHGIVSYGFQDPPSVYTRVSAFLPWIKETIG